jgi:hypothetical protein
MTMDKKLEGATLDEAVAAAIGAEPGADYSTSWHHAGPLIEKHRITVIAHDERRGDRWSATVNDFSHYIDEPLPLSCTQDGATGQTALVAAMRALVRSKTPNV